ncbi:hypothetical protein [Nocardioides taihuensis]|uniref:PE-PGRS family protein n=1 Tax=Nocardioides taihuensis TaxID=1835606 RepID=A0ABW0BQA7_9ACTN
MTRDERTDSRTVGFLQLAKFLEGGRLKGVVAELEHELASASGAEVSQATEEVGMGGEPGIALFTAAVQTRQRLGRLSDLIHATGIALMLPALLEPDERLTNRPSLAAGNDPSRPFDVETDRRIMEFKFGVWQPGSNADRKRGVFHDLLHLAADPSGRRPELYVVGPQAEKFLLGTTSKVAWALNRQAEKSRQLFEERFGSVDIPIPEFTRGPAAHVQIVDLEQRLPVLGAALST